MTLWRAVTVTAALIVAVGCQKPEKAVSAAKTSAVPEKPPVPVEAMVVSTGVLSREICASGVAAGVREAYVIAETQGVVQDVSFSLGEYVKQGKVLVQVDETVQKAAAVQAEKSAEAATLNLRVTQTLFDQGNAAEAELTGAQAQATGAGAGLEAARKTLANCRIVAPISGYIAQRDRLVQQGSFLAGGTVVTRIVDLSSLKVTVSVGEMEVGLLAKGMKAKVRVPAAGDREFDASAAAIAAGADPASGSYAVEVVWRNTKDVAVKSGMSARVTIVTESPDEVVLIPAGAVGEVEQRTAVFVASRGQAAARFVTTGRANGNLVEITDGIEVGDTLVTTGVTSLARGDRLAVTVVGSSGGAR